jgi:tripartite-type tricarboxylate transporter receptor subunit TctC
VGEYFAQQAGIKIEHVPYKGAAQGLADLAGGHIVFSAQTVSSSSALLRSGTLLGLAQSASARMPDYPAVPTFRELGYPDIVSTVWFALSGPAGLPDDIVRNVNSEIMRAMNAPEAQERLRQGGLIAQPMTVEQFNAYIASETARWKPVIERIGLAGK